MPWSGTLLSCPDSRNIPEGRPGAHCRRLPQPAHPVLPSRYLPSAGPVPTPLLRSLQCSRPGIFPLTGYLPFHLSRRPRPEYLLFPTLALLVRLSWDTCNPTQFPAQGRLPPAASLSPGPCRAARLLRGLSPDRRHSPRIPSLRKDSVSFSGARATNLGATGGVASRRANLSLANECRRTPLHRPGLCAIGWVT